MTDNYLRLESKMRYRLLVINLTLATGIKGTCRGRIYNIANLMLNFVTFLRIYDKNAYYHKRTTKITINMFQLE